MQPAAARVGPSNEPSVRRIAARFSSGATICIEKTIKVRLFRSFPKKGHDGLLASTSQEARQHSIGMASAGKGQSKQRARFSAGGTAARFNTGCPPKLRRSLRNLGVARQQRARNGCFQNFYVAVLSSISSGHALRRALARFLRRTDLSV